MKKYILLSALFIFTTLAAQQYVAIPTIRQGKSSVYLNKKIKTSGVVTAKFLGNGTIGGFFIQDKIGDGNPNTSDGIFVSASNNSAIKVGNEIRFVATVTEQSDRIILKNITNIAVESQGNEIKPLSIVYDVHNWDWAKYEGMLVEFDQIFWVNDNRELKKYGTLELGVKRKGAPSDLALPSASADSEYAALVNENSLLPIYLDDGLTATFVTPPTFADQSGARRTGERIDRLRAVVGYDFDDFVLYPVEEVFFYGNPRKVQHDDIGNYNIKVCGFNLKNYFTTPNTSMGPATAGEVERQHKKIVEALVAIDADIYGLVEIEQGQQALAKLTQSMNVATNSNYYTFINDGTSANGTYTQCSYIYRSDKIAPYKQMKKVSSIGPQNRKKLQGFELKSNNEKFIYSINHFKAKVGCKNAQGANKDQGDGQGCYNYTRVQEAKAVIATIDANKNFYDTDNALIMGDLNAYTQEDPIRTFTQSGYIDELHKFQPDTAYSYVYQSQVGCLDHVIANQELDDYITGVTVFHINSDELPDFAYNKSMYQPDMYRSSDHDPVIVGLALGGQTDANESFLEQTIHVYPTVVSDVLNIDGAEDSYIQLYSLNGILLFQEKNNLDNYKLNICSLNLVSGTYIIRILIENEIIYRLIVVN